MHGNTDDTDDGRPSRDPARIEPPSAPLGGAGGPEEPGPAIPSETELSPEAPGARKLNLVGSSQLTRAVAEAVRRGLAKQFVFTEEQLETAVRSIGREMMRRLKANSKSVRGLPKDAFLREVRADRNRIEAAREAARRELESMLVKLKNVHDQVNAREAELVAESQATSRIQNEELSQKITEIFESLKQGADTEEIREQITAVAIDSLQEERDRSIEAQMSEHREEVEQFERRIAKLTESLEITEDELKRIATAKNIEVGVGSIYRTVQGLSADDDDFETKKELMSSIFAANFELQKGPAGD